MAKLSVIIDETTWVKGLGAHEGRRAKHLCPGNVVLSQEGAPAKVVAISDVIGDVIILRLKSDAKDIEYERQFNKEEIVALQGLSVWNITNQY